MEICCGNCVSKFGVEILYVHLVSKLCMEIGYGNLAWKLDLEIPHGHSVWKFGLRHVGQQLRNASQPEGICACRQARRARQACPSPTRVKIAWGMEATNAPSHCRVRLEPRA